MSSERRELGLLAARSERRSTWHSPTTITDETTSAWRYLPLIACEARRHIGNRDLLTHWYGSECVHRLPTAPLVPRDVSVRLARMVDAADELIHAPLRPTIRVLAHRVRIRTPDPLRCLTSAVQLFALRQSIVSSLCGWVEPSYGALKNVRARSKDAVLHARRQWRLCD